MIIPAADIHAWLYTLPKEQFEQLTTEEKDWNGESCPGDEFDITYYLSECTPKFRAWLLEQGLGVSRPWNGNALIHFNPETVEAIEVETINIINELDAPFEVVQEHPRTTVKRMPTWDKYGLQGDDDVDYNGGYIQIAIDILRAYVARGEL